MAAALLHDPAVRERFRARALALRADTPRRWGRMSVDQMLWHLSTSMRIALGECPTQIADSLLTRTVVRWLVLHGPWPRGRAPTLREMRPLERYDFVVERDRLLELMERAADWPLQAHWPRHAAFGALSGVQWSRLQARHVEHHFRQFGV